MTEAKTKKKKSEKTTEKKVEEKTGTITIFIMGKGYAVPAGLTIMSAIEYAGYKFVRSCGCRAGFCGACATVYRKEEQQKLNFALACQTLAEDGMYLVQLPFVPASKAMYDLDKVEMGPNTVLQFYPEIARCVSCNTCTKSCPQDIEVMKYIQAALRGDVAKCAELSFDCIQCGMCAMRCPADIKHYHVSQLARRLYSRFVAPKYKHLTVRVKEIEDGKYDKEMGSYEKAKKDKLTELYKDRDHEEGEKA
jgi:heterodisulfide reductase subunit C